MVPEYFEYTAVGRYCEVVEVAADDLSQPFPLIGDRLVHAPAQLPLDLPQLRSHAIPPGAGKNGRRVVSAFIGTAFAQDDADAAKLQWRRVADQSAAQAAEAFRLPRRG